MGAEARDADEPDSLSAAGSALAEKADDPEAADELDQNSTLDPLEMLARGSAFVSRQVARLIARADRNGGRLDKAEIEGLVSLSRMMERWEALARERAKENQISSDAELAGILERIDNKIRELAWDYARDIAAGRLGQEQPVGQAGAAGA